jgi:ribosomal protein S18
VAYFKRKVITLVNLMLLYRFEMIGASTTRLLSWYTTDTPVVNHARITGRRAKQRKAMARALELAALTSDGMDQWFEALTSMRHEVALR